MVRVHGSWGHHVRPGTTDPARYGSYYDRHPKDDPPWLDVGAKPSSGKDDGGRKKRERDRKRKPSRPSASMLMPSGGLWTPNEDELIRKWYPEFGSDIARWPQSPTGRDRASIILRADDLGVRLAGESAERGAPGKHSGTVKYRSRERERNRPWAEDEDELIRRMYPVYGAETSKWPEKLHLRRQKAIAERARHLGVDVGGRREPDAAMAHEPTQASGTSLAGRQTDESHRPTDPPTGLPGRTGIYAVYDFDGTLVGSFTWREVQLNFNYHTRKALGHKTALGMDALASPSHDRTVMLTPIAQGSDGS